MYATVSALLFSATFRRKVERLARDILADPVRVVQGEAGVVRGNILTAPPTMNSFAPYGVHHLMNAVSLEYLYLSWNNVCNWWSELNGAKTDCMLTTTMM